MQLATRSKALGSLAALMFVVSLFIWAFRTLPARGENPQAISEQVRESYLNMDAKALYARLSKAEKRRNNLTEAKFEKLCRTLIFPRMKSWKVAKGESRTLGRGEQGLSRFDVELPNQPPITLTLIVWVGPDGAATDSIADLLFPIYYVEGLSNKKHVRDSQAGDALRLAGLKRDREMLREFGVNSFTGYSPHEGEYLSKDIDSMIGELEQRVAPNRAQAH